MASRQQIKRRITSVKSTKQITRAMQMVAASKLRRAQEAAIGPREYARLAREILTHLRSLDSDTAEGGALFAERPVKNRAIVLVASDKGLAGAYNSNVVRQTIQELVEDDKNHVKTSLIAVGRQAATAATRLSKQEVLAVYPMFDKPTANDIRPLLNTVVELFTDKKVDAVDVIYTKFVSTVRQEVQVQRLLPAGFESEEVSQDIASAQIEPSVDELLEAATVRLLEAQLYQILFEAAASEHSMRMLAMKNATDNASDIVEDLTLEFNTARQAAITQELAEISGGAEAIK